MTAKGFRYISVANGGEVGYTKKDYSEDERTV